MSAIASSLKVQNKRVVVTGIGLATCLGFELGDVFQKVIDKKTGISPLKSDEWKGLPCKVAGVVSTECLMKEFTKGDMRDKSRPILLGVSAARRALRHSKYTPTSDKDMHRCGVSVGMGMCDLQEIFKAGQALQEKGLRGLSPFFMPRNLVNMASGHISIETGFQGPNLSVSTACTTGLHAIGEAYRLVQRGDADLMLCGGTEAPISPLSIAGFSRMRALCTDSNDSPQTASRPFDKSRSGFVMSEGAAVIVLEDREHALARGAEIIAEVLGYGLSGDAYHISSPRESGDGALRCMKASLEDAQLPAEAISYVNAHATSTVIGDAAEARAIDCLFGSHATSVYVSSIKGAFGHLLGAAGSLEAAITAFACCHGVIPPTANLMEPDVPGNFKHVMTSAQRWESEDRIALTNSFGFGGTNASLCLSNHET
ncbi:3-oxoacyl-[acyl-carrier-protein] synthase, mitochondrial-like [Watersipora subatra]|uniref:3-oxoacyl-[acyl-carrier-protein] synthase, mitochondrial-like n=1 Tax=Watersipora subatra TaxID=2589382 RepID=UPI00355C636E